MSACAVIRHLFSCAGMTTQPDALSCHQLMKRNDISHIQINNLLRIRRPFGFVKKSGDCTDHRAWYARGLVDQPAQMKSEDCTDHRAWHAWGLVDQSTQIRSGTTPTTEHDTLGDWSIRLYTRQRFTLIIDYV